MKLMQNNPQTGIALHTSDQAPLLHQTNNGSAVVKLYFDGVGNTSTCLGGMANDWWLTDYIGEYVGSAYFRLPKDYNPVGKTGLELKQETELIG